MIPGPYTLLLFLIEPGGLFGEMKREPRLVAEALFQLASFLAQVGAAYRNAGADFITIHDMGGSPGFIGPAKYEQFVYPAQKLLIAELPAPRALRLWKYKQVDGAARADECGCDLCRSDQRSCCIPQNPNQHPALRKSRSGRDDMAGR